MTRELHFTDFQKRESDRISSLSHLPHPSRLSVRPLTRAPLQSRDWRSREVLCTSPLDLAQGLRECGLNVCAFAGVWNVKIFPSHAKQQTLCLNSAKRQKRKETDRH